MQEEVLHVRLHMLNIMLMSWHTTFRPAQTSHAVHNQHDELLQAEMAEVLHT